MKHLTLNNLIGITFGLLLIGFVFWLDTEMYINFNFNSNGFLNWIWRG